MSAAENLIEPGYYTDISNAAYHGGPGVSKSQLDLLHTCPALLQWAKAAPEDEEKKSSLNVGDAVHAILLEPERFTAEYVAWSGANRSTKEGKAEWAEFEANLNGRTVLTQEENRKIQLIRESVLAHPHARWIVEADGDVEASIYWNDPATGLLCRCRPDKLINKFGWIVDVKTTADMSKFARSVYDYRYHVQDPFYSDGYHEHFGEAPAGFVFLVVSTSIDCGRYPVRLFVLDNEAKSIGRKTYQNDLATLYGCQKSGEWPAIETLSLPRWALEKGL